MEAKEKAKQLVNEFREHANGADEDDRFSPAIEKENAKQCALIAVRELVKESYDMGNNNRYKYFQEVEQEIEKL